MQKAGQALFIIFEILGERAALLVIVVLAGIVISTQSTSKAFSEENRINGISSEGSPPSVTFTPTPTPTPEPTATPTPTPTPSPTRVPQDSNDDSVWDKLADCETHKNWVSDTGNGYFGGLQFTESAWQSVGGSDKASNASRDEQIMRGKMLQARRGWGPWSSCAKRLGLY